MSVSHQPQPTEARQGGITIVNEYEEDSARCVGAILAVLSRVPQRHRPDAGHDTPITTESAKPTAAEIEAA